MPKTASRLWSALFLASTIVGASQQAFSQGLSRELQDSLAHRFRPYIKTTRDGDRGEVLRPASWQWFVRHSTLVSDYQGTRCDLRGGPGLPYGEGTADPWPSGTVQNPSQTLAENPSIIIQLPAADLRGVLIDGKRSDPAGDADLKYALHLDDPAFRAGESWNDVTLLGQGIYAHLEVVPYTDGQVVNIEYTILWAYNEAYCSQHNGDLTSIAVVYDRGTDLLSRVTYSIHGYALETFRLANPQQIRSEILYGRDDAHQSQSMAVAQLALDEGDTYRQGGVHHSPSDATIYLAQDPVTLLYEHPVVFAEFGGHELWPNTTGSILLASDHSGTGFSFLPRTVQVLGTLDMPRPEHEAFLFFNGKWGTDPQAILMHRSWFWPEGRAANRFRIPESRFTDHDPYRQLGSLPWPPAREQSGAASQLYLNTDANNWFAANRAEMPFPDLMTALSFAPRFAELVLETGKYPARVTLARAVTLKARNGSVMLGQQ